MDIPSYARIADPQVSSRGAKYALIDNNKLHGDGKIRITIGTKDNPTSSPFGVSTYNNDDATKKNIENNFARQINVIARILELTGLASRV